MAAEPKKNTNAPQQDTGAGARRRRRVPPPPRHWETADDEELLRMRICDLDVRIEGSPLESRIQRLYDELDARGISFHPPCYLTTEWLCPDRVPAIGIPFCLAHPRLQKLEEVMMLEVEGGTENECMKLLRHEAGHAINYAYRLYRRTRWRELFGPISTDYDPDEYRMRPYSRRYVIHLRDNYAQAHPDEDFAETFAVWLTPGLDWRRKYQGWGALKKLQYVDHVMAEIGQRRPEVTGGLRLWPIASVRSTLANYYKRKRRQFAEAYPGFYDDILLRLFSRETTAHGPAARFLSRHRRNLVNTVARWAPVRKYTVDQIIRRLAQRSGELNLWLRAPEQESLFPVGICITTLVLEARERFLKRLKHQET